MNPLMIIQQAAVDGVELALSETGTIKIRGDQALVDRWVPIIREHKPDIVAAMREAENDSIESTSSNQRIDKMIAALEGDPGSRYATKVHDDIEPDAMILTLAIRGKGACELRIPKSRYDASALLELIEKHTTRGTLQ